MVGQNLEAFTLEELAHRFDMLDRGGIDDSSPVDLLHQFEQLGLLAADDPVPQADQADDHRQVATGTVACVATYTCP